MNTMVTAKECANRWGISERRVGILCQQGRIEGAVKVDRQWRIPAGTEKPEDQRRNSAQEPSDMVQHSEQKKWKPMSYIELEKLSQMEYSASQGVNEREIHYGTTGQVGFKRPLPIGLDDFEKLIERGYYYVDKTLLIKELLDRKGEVNLFTRPRRFGKSLNLSMLRYFFEIPTDGISRRSLFDGLKITEAGSYYMKQQGRFPVIKLTLKSAHQPSFAMAYEMLKDEIYGEYCRHAYVLQKDCLSAADRTQFEAFLSRTAEDYQYAKSLQFLTKCLRQYHGEKTIVLIDEYDVPLENAYFRGFYKEMIDFIRSLFESLLKSNDSLEFAIITGCLRISRESIFTGLNNLNVVSVLNRDYGEYFGFDEAEVARMLAFYDRSEKLETARKWYDGYRFGDINVYNPWSVINYVSHLISDREAFPTKAWSNSSSNSIVRDLVYHADDATRGELQELINGGTIVKRIHEDITYDDMRSSQENLWNFLFFTGYLTLSGMEMRGSDCYITLSIPNTEVLSIYQDKITNWFHDEIKTRDLSAMYEAMLSGEARIFEEELQKLLQSTISYMDGRESFYHGFLLGVLANLSGHFIKSNREAGNGRYDIALYNEDITTTPVILELKVVDRFGDLETAAEAGISQIIEKHYADPFAENGYTKLRAYGIGFFRKQIRVVERIVEL